MAARYSADCVAMDKPAVFIETQGSGKLSINEDVVTLLRQINNPVTVISIVGKYRTGKSYLMNRFLDTNAGFALGPTVQAFTKGIWIWIRPHPKDPSQTLVLLDTEGLHDAEKGDETHDMKLFSLALLLSSCLVYNATGTLDDIIIRQLQLVSELTEHIRTKQHEEEDGNQFNRYFPTFFLVLRDFFLKLEIDGRPCSPDDYMEHALKLRPGQGKKVREYNLPRECIRAFFPRRHCFVLCKPVDDDDKLTCLDQVHDSEIKPKFLDAATHATQKILSDGRPFELEGHKINGSRYVQLAMTYVEAINNGAIPCIASAVELLKNNECRRAMEEAASMFDATMSEELQGRLPVQVEELTRVQKVAHARALEVYRKGALFDSAQTYVSKLSETLDMIFQSHVQANNSASVDKSQALLTSLFKDIELNIQHGHYMGSGGYAKYKSDRDVAEAAYSAAEDLGPMKENVLNEFLQARQAQEHAIITADKALSEKEKELVYETEMRKMGEERAKAAAAEQKRVMQEMLAQQEAHQEMLHKVQADFTAQQQKLLEDHKKDLSEKEKEYQRMMSEGLTKQAEQYKDIIGELKEDRKRMEKDYQLQSEQMEALSASNKEIMSAMKDQSKMNEDQMRALRMQLDTIGQQKEDNQGGLFKFVGGFLGKAIDAFFKT